MFVPQLCTVEDVNQAVAPGSLPTLFQISQATGPFADVNALIAFQNLSVEYAGRVEFRKVAAGSLAAKRLYGSEVTKPVYVFSNSQKPENDENRYRTYDESDPRIVVDQVFIEGLFKTFLNIYPEIYAPFSLTADNEHHTLYEFKPDPAYQAPTTSWMVVLFYPNDASQNAYVNRLRVMMGLERLFYPNRLRFAEVNLSTQAKVYQSLIQTGGGGPLPTEPEIWVIDPDKHHTAQYVAGGELPTLRHLGHAAFEQWLSSNGVQPKIRVLDSYKGYRDILRQARLQEAMPTPN